MYRNLGPGGRLLWGLTVFVLWCALFGYSIKVFNAVHDVVTDWIYPAVYAGGFSSIVASVIELLTVVIGLLVFPGGSTWGLYFVNKKLKGT